MTAHAGLQQLWLGRTEELAELGLPDRPLTQLTAQVEEMVDDEFSVHERSVRQELQPLERERLVQLWRALYGERYSRAA